MFPDFKKQAEEMIRSRAERITPGRIQVLAMLLEERRAVSHHEIEQWFQAKRRLDRVTLYRVLEWLNDRGYIHRVVGDDRVWRFRANTDLNPHQHAHFECPEHRPELQSRLDQRFERGAQHTVRDEVLSLI